MRKIAHRDQFLNTRDFPSASWRLERFVPGLPASVAVLCGQQRMLPLPACQQRLTNDGLFTYQGGVLPLPNELNKRAQQLAQRSIASIPGSANCGYVGVDMVLGETDVVVDLNPRLTTSYVGLRRLTNGNIAQATLELCRGQDVDLSFEHRRVEFDATGNVQVAEMATCETGIPPGHSNRALPQED